MDLRENLRMTKRKIRRGKIRVYSAYLIFKYSFWYLFCQKVYVKINLFISVTLDFGNHKLARKERYIFDIRSYQTVRMYQIKYWKYVIYSVWNIITIYRFSGTVPEMQDSWSKFLWHTMTTIKSRTLSMRFYKRRFRQKYWP